MFSANYLTLDGLLAGVESKGVIVACEPDGKYQIDLTT